jgi:hypothetical protein
MIGYFPLLLSADDWTWLAEHFGPSPRRARTILVREDAPLAFAWARVLARLDPFERLRFARLDKADAGAGSLEVEDPTTGKPASGALAFICRWLATRESTIAKWFPLSSARRREPSAARAWFHRRAAELREVAAAVLIVASASQLLVENHAVPQRLKLPQPKWITQLVVYPRLLQGWQMFSSDVPTGERMLYVDAVTFGGRHVDPFNEAGSRVSTLPVDRIPPHMEQDEFWCDYTNRIPENEAYWRALKEWIFAYHLRTGRPEDRVIAFEAKLIEGESPAFGETQPKNWKTRVMTSARE